MEMLTTYIGTPRGTNVSTLIFDPNGPIAIFLAMSSILIVRHSPIRVDLLQFRLDEGAQFLSLGELLR